MFENQSKRYIFMFIIFNIFSVSVVGQVCTKQKLASRWYTEWYSYSYPARLTKTCWYGFSTCTYEKSLTVQASRSRQKHYWKTEQYCCPGYTVNSWFGEMLYCDPICDPECGNGTCISPGNCECFTGYSITTNGTCEPYCSNGCEHGKCISPNNCKCDEGYQNAESKICEPICDPDCGNGTCVSPGNCECFSGYSITTNGTCEPYCSNGCEHGKCISPNNCKCDEGYQNADSEKCEPICDPDCGNGTCVSPGNCECFSGYNITTEGTCQLQVSYTLGSSELPSEITDVSYVTDENSEATSYINETDYECKDTPGDISKYDDNVDNMTRGTKTERSTFYYWIIGAVLLGIALITSLIVMIKFLCNAFGTGSYKIEDTVRKDGCKRNHPMESHPLSKLEINPV